MPNMILGGYTFATNPSAAHGVAEKVRHPSKLDTYPGVAIFPWGVGIVGREVVLKWEIMPSTQFDQLQTLLESDAALVFDPQDGTGRTFNVELMDLAGTYHVLIESGANCYRSDASLTMLILSEIGV